MSTKKFLLQENDIPAAWYNIAADMENKPLPPLNPATKQPLNPEDLFPLFAKELVMQELNQTDQSLRHSCRSELTRQGISLP